MSDPSHTANRRARGDMGESRLIQLALIATAIAFLAAVLLLPLAVVFIEGLRKG